MTKEELYDLLLSSADHSREKRQQLSNLALGNPKLMKLLLEIGFNCKDPVSPKACWVIEFSVKQNVALIYPFLDIFTENLSGLTNDSSVRPCAKICEILITQFFSKSKNITQKKLTDKHLERITTACFDWLIGDHKVAAKAYSMTSLLLLGKKYDWIHPELKMVLEQNYESGTAAYKARARMTLAKLK